MYVFINAKGNTRKDIKPGKKKNRMDLSAYIESRMRQKRSQSDPNLIAKINTIILCLLLYELLIQEPASVYKLYKSN
jgi:hypothetical protein